MAKRLGVRYLISVVIPFYNIQDYIGEAIESVLEQSIGYEYTQIILVDDGSTDRSADICACYRDEFPNNIECISIDHAVLTVGDDVYVELNPHNNLFALRLDTLRRQNDFELPLECCVIRAVRLHLPEGYMVGHLPDDFALDVPQGRLSCTFEQEADAVLFTQRMLITSRRIARADVPAWNRSVSRWTDACNEQIILKRKP